MKWRLIWLDAGGEFGFIYFKTFIIHIWPVKPNIVFASTVGNSFYLVVLYKYKREIQDNRINFLVLEAPEAVLLKMCNFSTS